jgi:hypothetical protein
VPNNLEGIDRLRTNGQTMRFLIAAQISGRPLFVTGNADTIVRGLTISNSPQQDREALAIRSARLAPRWQVYIGRDAFDMPRLIGALAAALATTPDHTVN